MKIFIANSSEQKYGGGFSFIDNFKKGIAKRDDVFTTLNYGDADIFFIPSPTMVQRADVVKAKGDNKKVVLRIDNAVRDSRNRNTGMSRMKDFAELADLVIYQSSWAKNYLQPFTKKDGPVIINGIDMELFNSKNRPQHPKKTYMYSRFNRDETKNWEMARYFFSQLEGDNELYIIGQFSPELVDANFDFYQGESFKFWGVQPPEHLADLYRWCDYFLYTYFNDACSNSLIEALVSGCEIVDPYGMLKTGGAPEIMHKLKLEGLEYFSLDRMVEDYCREVFAL